MGLVMKAWRLTAAFALILCACAPASREGDLPPLMNELLAQADHDGDRLITRTELVSARAASFNEADADGSGVVSPGEFLFVFVGRPAARYIDGAFGTVDADLDGGISRLEWTRSPAYLFERADVNGDDVIDQRELRAILR